MTLLHWTPGSLAATNQTNNPISGTVNYSAETVALNSNSAAVPNGRLTYTTISGQQNGDSIVWTTTGVGTAFTGTPVAVCVPACAASVGVATVSGQTITVPITAAVPPGSTISLVSGNASNIATTVTGLANLGPAQAPGVVGVNTVFFGSPTAPASNSAGAGSLVDLITVQANSANPAFADANPAPDLALTSSRTYNVAINSLNAIVDLTGVGGSTPGFQFQRLTGSAAGQQPTTSTASSLGTLTINNNAGLIDARYANLCCNNSGNTPNGNSPLPFTASVTVQGDFQTITTAYLRAGNNIAASGNNPTVAGATTGFEQNPASQATSVCTSTANGSDIVSTPLPTANGFNTLTFAVPSSNVAAAFGGVNNQIATNPIAYALCIVTNNSNIIANTTSGNGAGGGSPGVDSIQGNVLGSSPPAGTTGVTTSVSLAFTGIPNSLGVLTNVHNGFGGFGDVVYAGSVVTFPNIFPASSGYPSSIRVVNTGLGTFPVYAVLQKDGQAPISIPGSFAAMTPFAAYYASVDSIAFQGGTTLAPRNTLTILTPAAPGSLKISRLLNDPSGDVVLTGNGL